MVSQPLDNVKAVDAPPIENRIAAVGSASGVSQTLMHAQSPRGSWENAGAESLGLEWVEDYAFLVGKLLDGAAIGPWAIL